MSDRTWLLLDCSFLGHRAMHSAGELSYEGVKTGTIFGFLSQVLDLQERFGSGNVVFAFDSKTSLRKEIFPDYKRKRHTKELTEEERAALDELKRQLRLLRRRVLPSLGFSNVFQAKGFEGDDIIARIAEDGLPEGDEAVIVSADHDLFQCISERVSFFNPNKRQSITLRNFEHITGVRRPSQWRLVLEIAGCRTDGVPGVGGVAEKTAVQFINNQLKPTSVKYKNITTNHKARDLSRQLTSLPLSETPWFALSKDKLHKEAWDPLCARLGFRSLRKRWFYPPSK